MPGNWDVKPPGGVALPSQKEMLQQQWPVGKSSSIGSMRSGEVTQTASAAEKDLWEVHSRIDESQRRTIYYNKKTGISTYEKPACLKTAVELARDSAEGADGALDPKAMLAKVRAAEAQDRLDEEERFESGMKRNQMSGYLDADSFQQASLDIAIGADNRGYKLLQKMGWKAGTGLGKKSAGIVAPLNPLGQQTEEIKRGGMERHITLGLGKAEEYDTMTDEAAKERRKLDTEVKQTEELIEKKRKKAEQEVKTEKTLKDQNKEFYCEWCNKQYKTVGEFSNHLSSYDHHHVKRFKEMKAMEKARLGGKSNADKKRRREQKREEEQLRKRMAAAGVPMPPKQKTNQRAAPAVASRAPAPPPVQSVPAAPAAPGVVAARQLSVEQIMAFYRKHDVSKADRETAEYILSSYSTEEVLKSLMDRYGEVPPLHPAPSTSSSSSSSSSTTTAALTAASGPAATPTSNKLALSIEQIMAFYRKHDVSKADRETAEYILSSYSTEEVLKSLMDRYGEVPAGFAAPVDAAANAKAGKIARRKALLEQMKAKKRLDGR